MKDLKLDPHEYNRKGEKPIEKPKYPRKTWFGLTDYGPPPLSWGMVVGLIVTWTIIVVGQGLLEGRFQ